MSGAYLENLDKIHPGLNDVLGKSTDLRGTTKHIVEKARRIRREEGIHHLSADQLLVMMSYWEGLGKNSDHLRTEPYDFDRWHDGRISTYSWELLQRGIYSPHHPEHEKFREVGHILWVRNSE